MFGICIHDDRITMLIYYNLYRYKDIYHINIYYIGIEIIPEYIVQHILYNMSMKYYFGFLYSFVVLVELIPNICFFIECSKLG